MKELVIAEGLSLPIDVVTMTQAILARKRSGKSYLAQKLAEQLLHAGQQIVALDPTSAWWGLRSSADGNGPGFPVVVFGGSHADAPLDFRSGAAMARAVVEHGFSAVFDVGEIDIEEQIVFGTEFCKALLKLNRNAMHLLMDEAHNWAPQNAVTKQEKHSLSAVKRLVLQGGIRGIGFTMISQRTALLNKDVLSQVDLLTVLRMSHPLDIKAVTDWIKSEVGVEFANQVEKALPGLPRGTAFLSSAPLGLGQRIQVAAKETFDSGATPKPGERRIEPKVLAPIDIQKLGAQIADSIREQEANSPDALKARIAELERELETAGSGGQISKEREQMLVEQIQQMETELASYRIRFTKIGEAADTARRLAEQLEDMRGLIQPQIFHELPKDSAAAEALSRPAFERLPDADRTCVQPRRREQVSIEGLDGPSSRVLRALAELEAVHISPAPREQVAVFAGYTHLQSKGLVNALGSLRTSGLIDYPESGKVILTPEGRRAAPKIARPATERDFHERLLQMLGGPEARILGVIIGERHRAMPRQALAAAAGYSHLQSKGFANSLGRLRTLGLIDYPESGMVRGTDLLFFGQNGRRA